MTKGQSTPGGGAGPADSTVLEARELVKTFFLGKKIYAVKDVSVTVERGEFAAVVGPSGCGKSTLLTLLGGLDRPDSGDVLLEGRSYRQLNENGLALLRRRNIGFVFQFFNLINHLTALENVMLPMRFTGVPGRVVREKAEHLLELVGLAERRTHLPLQMSGGEQQRVAIARALGNDPALVLADEPTGNLDTRTGQQVAQLFIKLNREHGQTFVVVSHDLALAGLANQVFRMQDGQIAEITRNPR